MDPQPISLDELPRYSDWPAILLGAKQFSARHRTRNEVLREYDREKWGSVLAWLKTRSVVTADDLLREQGLDPEQIVAFANDGRFLVASTRVVMEAYERLLLDTLLPRPADVLVELGSGLGDKLLTLAQTLKPRTVWGGELTSSGVACGRLLAKLCGTAAGFGHFDYNNEETIEDVPKDALVYTSHSIEQIPMLEESFIRGLIRRAPRVVVHFEPCYDDQDDKTVLGLMRRRYTELNDYNRNLLGLLRLFERTGQIRILEHRPNVFSDQPFNSTSIIAWSPE